ncbi:M48 family metalloprotease [Deinococcus multiflagellatus]|uniref:M48 family metalloprotease n=1 Tax=Deinococcus multiflagellatus TaxID=1656887 RepID=A0ABW1ZNA0_9DEIO
MVERPAASPTSPFGVPVPLEQEPELRALIEETAQALKVPLPDEVRLLPDMNAYMSVRGQRATLGLGLPLLLSLSRAEVQAVVAHELAHLGQGDAARVWRLSGLASGLFRTMLNLNRGDPEAVVAVLPQGVSTVVLLHMMTAKLLALPMVAIAQAYLKRVEALNHAQEHAADLAAQQVAGAEATRSALQRVAVEAWLFDAYVEHDLLPLAQAGFRVPIAEGFEHFLAGEHAERLRGWTAQDLPAREATLSHPSLRVRLEQLAEQAPARPAAALPGVRLRRADEWSGQFYTPKSATTLQPVSWEELDLRHWPAHWQTLATNEDLQVALRGVTLAGVAEVCADLNAHLRARFPQLQYEGVGGDERHLLVGWLAVGVLLCALRQGAEASVRPGHPWAAQLQGHTLVPYTQLWAMVSHSDARRQWPQTLMSLGLQDQPLLSPEIWPAEAQRAQGVVPAR